MTWLTCRMFPSKIKPEHCWSLFSLLPELKLELWFFFLFVLFLKSCLIFYELPETSVSVVRPPPSSSSNLFSTNFLGTCSSSWRGGVSGRIWSGELPLAGVADHWLYSWSVWRGEPFVAWGESGELLPRCRECSGAIPPGRGRAAAGGGGAGPGCPVLPGDGEIPNAL